MSNCNTPATDADIEGIREGASEVYDSNEEPHKCQGAYWDLRLIAKIDSLRTRVAELEGVLEKINNGGLPDGVMGNVTERMLAMCAIARQALAPLSRK